MCFCSLRGASISFHDAMEDLCTSCSRDHSEPRQIKFHCAKLLLGFRNFDINTLRKPHLSVLAPPCHWQFIISGGDNLFQQLISKDSWGFPIVFMLELRNSISARRSVRARPWVPQKYIPSAFWRREGDTVVKMHSALWLAAARHYWERSIWSLPRYHVLSCCILHLDTL